jgi:hypothetical protein
MPTGKNCTDVFGLHRTGANRVSPAEMFKYGRHATYQTNTGTEKPRTAGEAYRAKHSRSPLLHFLVSATTKSAQIRHTPASEQQGSLAGHAHISHSTTFPDVHTGQVIAPFVPPGFTIEYRSFFVAADNVADETPSQIMQWSTNPLSKHVMTLTHRQSNRETEQ